MQWWRRRLGRGREVPVIDVPFGISETDPEPEVGDIDGVPPGLAGGAVVGRRVALARPRDPARRPRPARRREGQRGGADRRPARGDRRRRSPPRTCGRRPPVTASSRRRSCPSSAGCPTPSATACSTARRCSRSSTGPAPSPSCASAPAPSTGCGRRCRCCSAKAARWRDCPGRRLGRRGAAATGRGHGGSHPAPARAARTGALPPGARQPPRCLAVVGGRATAGGPAAELPTARRGWLAPAALTGGRSAVAAARGGAPMSADVHAVVVRWRGGDEVAAACSRCSTTAARGSPASPSSTRAPATAVPSAWRRGFPRSGCSRLPRTAGSRTPPTAASKPATSRC